jgi:hypothetical protein
MPNSTDVAVETKSFSIIPGETLRIVAAVKNSGTTMSQFNFRIEGLDEEWYSLPVSSATLFPNDEEKLQITFAPPKKENVKAGRYDFHFITERLENPNNIQDTLLTLEVKDTPECTIEIVPEINFGTKGIYRIIAHNKGETTVSLQILVVSLDTPFKYRLQPASLSVPGKGIAESTLHVWLAWWRFLRTKKQYDFTIFARQNGSGYVKTVNGKLVRFPENKKPPVKPPPELKPSGKPPDITRFEAIAENNGLYALVWETGQAEEVKLDNILVGLKGEAPVSLSKKTDYILTASNKNGAVSRTVTVEPPPVLKETYSDRILVSLEPDILKVTAGLGQVESMLEVQNAGSIVDKFSLEIEGLPREWYSFSAPLVALMPHSSEQVRIIFHPPKVSGVKSGNYPFSIKLRSESVPEDIARAIAQLEILPSVDFGITIKPYRLFCRRTCTFKARIVNRDVSNAVLFLDVSDIESGLRFLVDNDSPVVPPWQSVEVSVAARPRRNSIIGDIKRYDISVNATTAEGTTQTARCQIDHKPYLSSWRPVLRILGTILITAIIAFAVYYVIRMGGGWNSLLLDPKTWLDGVVRHIRGWFY